VIVLVLWVGRVRPIEREYEHEHEHEYDRGALALAPTVGTSLTGGFHATTCD